MRLLAVWFCLSILLAPMARAGQTFTIGVLPIHSARVLAARYEPLRAYLEQHLNQPARIESAVNFANFQARTLRGDFDLTITPAHFARLAQKDAGFQPLAQFVPDHDALLVYAAERPLRDAADLRGKTLAVIDRLAISVTAVISHLEEQGLEVGRDYRALEHRTHASAAYSLVNGGALAAVTTSQGLLQMPEDLRGKLVVMRHVADIPAFVFVARPEASPARVARLKSLLLAFPNHPEGGEFLRRIGYSAVLPASEQRMRRADAFLKATRAALRP